MPSCVFLQGAEKLNLGHCKVQPAWHNEGQKLSYVNLSDQHSTIPSTAVEPAECWMRWKNFSRDYEKKHIKLKHFACWYVSTIFFLFIIQDNQISLFCCWDVIQVCFCLHFNLLILAFVIKLWSQIQMVQKPQVLHLFNTYSVISSLSTLKILFPHNLHNYAKSSLFIHVIVSCEDVTCFSWKSKTFTLLWPCLHVLDCFRQVIRDEKYWKQSRRALGLFSHSLKSGSEFLLSFLLLNLLGLCLLLSLLLFYHFLHT